MGNQWRNARNIISLLLEIIDTGSVIRSIDCKKNKTRTDNKKEKWRRMT